MINDYEATHAITNDLDYATRGSAANDDVVSLLNELIETCRDGQQGFQEAADGVERSDMKTFFSSCSLERAGFVGELQSLVRSLGGEPAEEGSMAGALHRGWIDLKAAITGKDDEAILNECERGEDSAKETYHDALAEELPSNVREVLERQAAAIRDKHDRIKALRDFASDRATGSTAGQGGY
jgi:uncharacterized protein (TIGR02284 family)